MLADVDVILAGLNVAAIAATALVALLYIRWHRRHRRQHPSTWWHGLGMLPLVVGLGALAELVEGTYYGGARVLRFYDAADLWASAAGTTVVNVLTIAGTVVLLLPYWVGKGHSWARIGQEAACVAALLLTVFAGVLLALQ